MAEPTTKKRSFFSQKICRFCNDDDSKVYIDFHDIKALKPLISERGKMFLREFLEIVQSAKGY